jgi:hypothetical protein
MRHLPRPDTPAAPIDPRRVRGLVDELANAAARGKLHQHDARYELDDLCGVLAGYYVALMLPTNITLNEMVMHVLEHAPVWLEQERRKLG